MSQLDLVVLLMLVGGIHLQCCPGSELLKIYESAYLVWILLFPHFSPYLVIILIGIFWIFCFGSATLLLDRRSCLSGKCDMCWIAPALRTALDESLTPILCDLYVLCESSTLYSTLKPFSLLHSLSALGSTTVYTTVYRVVLCIWNMRAPSSGSLPTPFLEVTSSKSIADAHSSLPDEL